MARNMVDYGQAYRDFRLTVPSTFTPSSERKCASTRPGARRGSSMRRV